jgi:hypothetical protein
MNSDTVNPMPASVASPSTWRVDSPRGSTPIPRRTAARLAPVMPAILPASSPSATPAMVACTPDSTVAAHTSSPSGT